MLKRAYGKMVDSNDHLQTKVWKLTGHSSEPPDVCTHRDVHGLGLSEAKSRDHSTPILWIDHWSITPLMLTYVPF